MLSTGCIGITLRAIMTSLLLYLAVFRRYCIVISSICTLQKVQYVVVDSVYMCVYVLLQCLKVEN